MHKNKMCNVYMESTPQLKKEYEKTPSVFFAFSVLIVSILITGYITQYAWNNSVSEIFGIKNITVVQAILLIVLFNVLLQRS